MKIRLRILYMKMRIKIHWFFIKRYRREMDSLVGKGKIVVSKELLRVDKLLNYHCLKVMQLEYKYLILLA